MAKYLHNNCQTGLNKGGVTQSQRWAKRHFKIQIKVKKSAFGIFLYFLSSQVDVYKGHCCRCEVSAMMVSEWVGVLEVGLVGCHHLIIIDLIPPHHCHPENNTSLHCRFNFTKLSGTIRDKSQTHGVTDWWNDNGGLLCRFCSSLWDAHLTNIFSRKHFIQIRHHHCMALAPVSQ